MVSDRGSVPRFILPRLEGSSAAPHRKSHDQRGELESLSQFQKLTCWGGVLRGAGPLPPAVGTSGGPGKALPAPSSPGAPQDSRSPPPTAFGHLRLSPWSAGRPGRDDYDFKVDSQTVLGQSGVNFYIGGRAPGSDGPEDQSSGVI